MQNKRVRVRIKKCAEISVIALLCVAILLLDVVRIPFAKEEFHRLAISKIIQQALGSVLTIACLIRYGIRLFGKPQNFLYLIPCILVALDNFQWSAFFQGKMQLVRTSFLDILLFVAQCFLTGLFEETVFRGVLFAVLASVFGANKKGFLQTFVLSSVLFGLSHFFNGISVGTLLQVGYSCLTGGLFAFCLIKTKNILCSAFIHGLYNVCGLLYDTQGLGTGVVFDVGTVGTMLIVSVLVGIFVLYKVWKYPDEERRQLYVLLGVNKIENNNAEDKL